MERWEELRIIKDLKNESPTRFQIIKILEENPNGLLVKEIHEKLKKTGFDISQPAVSKHLAVLWDMGLVSEIKRKDERLKRNIGYYQSLASCYRLVSDKLMKKTSQVFAGALEEMEDKLPKFENIFQLQNFLTHIAEAVGGEIGVSDDLYSQLSQRKVYGELIKLLWKYQDAVSYVDIALENEKWMDKARDMLAPHELETIKDRYNMAMRIISRSLDGDKGAIGFLEELLQVSVEPLKQGLAKTIEFIKGYQGDRRLL